MLPDLAKVVGLTIDSDLTRLVIDIELIVHSVVDQLEDQLLHVRISRCLEGEDTLVVEEEGERTPAFPSCH